MPSSTATSGRGARRRRPRQYLQLNSRRRLAPYRVLDADLASILCAYPLGLPESLAGCAIGWHLLPARALHSGYQAARSDVSSTRPPRCCRPEALSAGPRSRSNAHPTARARFANSAALYRCVHSALLVYRCRQTRAGRLWRKYLEHESPNPRSLALRSLDRVVRHRIRRVWRCTQSARPRNAPTLSATERHDSSHLQR
jgi:hypothetical protein